MSPTRPKPKKSETQDALRLLPSVDSLLMTRSGRELSASAGQSWVTNAARGIVEQLRAEIRSITGEESRRALLTRESLVAEAESRLVAAHKMEEAGRLRRVINATGVIVHTNLGRAPLSSAARRAVADEAGRYCTLEFDLESGERGRRGASIERLIAELTGAEEALVVNNCAAAALLNLSTLASGGETIVSRGELVEIGGDFRVPEVMSQSGTRMVEVGTTNRTKLADYRRAVTAETRLIMRVHPSNYRVIGFTASPSLAELAALAREANVPLYEDAGSGALIDFTQFGMRGEPLIADSLREGADVVSFSGDKLLGGPQAGLIAGRRELVNRMRRNPLYRALRADKLALAALEATLLAFRAGRAQMEVPVIAMLGMSRDEIARRALALVCEAKNRLGESVLSVEVLDGVSAVGGGAAPDFQPPTALIAVTHPFCSADEIALKLRRSAPPVIARIAEGKVLLDLRTVTNEEEADVARAICALA